VQYLEATERFQEALRLRPDFGDASNNLGNALREQGREDEAAEAFRAAVRCRPELAAAHANLGDVLLGRGELDEALVHCREAVRRQPDFAPGLNNLGNVLRKLGQLDEAKGCYRQALKLAPATAMTCNNMGQALEEEGLLEEAVAWYQRALDRDANSPRYHTNLARALAEQKQYESAHTHYQIALRLDPYYAEAHNGLGALLRDRNQPEQALAHIQEALRLKPELAFVHVNLGHSLLQRDQLEQAVASYREALRLDPSETAAYVSLANALDKALPVDDLHAIEELLAKGRVSEPKRVDLLFALAQILDAKQQYRPAAERAAQANGLRKQILLRQGEQFGIDEHVQLVDQIIARFDRDFFERVRGWGLTSELPVFFVGLPRSGKTLLEHLLAGHPHVFGAGELQLARASFESFPGILGSQEPPIECVHRWERHAVEQVAQQYLAQLRALHPDASRIVDTMPHNYLWLGMIFALFPRARIVHCRRDLRDTALACWMKNFKHLTWACDGDQLSGWIRQYCRVMDHWNAVLPVDVLEVDYEETVREPERVARQLVDWMGLPWDSGCLAFLHGASELLPSPDEVKPPLHAKFVQRWPNYLEPLAPLFNQLPR
jgi:tetratricopeptide (TPR) repeat protein